MGFGFASAGSMAGLRPWHQRNQTSPRDGWYPSRGFVRLYSAGFSPSIPQLGSLVKADDGVGTDPYTFNHRLLREHNSWVSECGSDTTWHPTPLTLFL